MVFIRAFKTLSTVTEKFSGICMFAPLSGISPPQVFDSDQLPERCTVCVTLERGTKSIGDDSPLTA